MVSFYLRAPLILSLDFNADKSKRIENQYFSLTTKGFDFFFKILKKEKKHKKC